MKKIQFLPCFLVFILTFVSCKKETEKTPVTNTTKTEIVSTEPENLALASFTIEGMHCEIGCAGYLQKKLSKLDGVKSATIDFDTKKATIEYNANVQTPEILIQTVESAADGKTYKVTDLQS